MGLREKRYCPVAMTAGHHVRGQRETPRREEPREARRIDAEGPWFAGAMQRRDELLCSREGGRAVEESTMHVREEEPASGCCRGEVPKGRIDRLLGEVVGHAFPDA